jgi:hypothetical protein
MAKNGFLLFFPLVGLTVVVVVDSGGMVCNARAFLVVGVPVNVGVLAAAAVGEGEGKEDEEVDELDKGGKLSRQLERCETVP